MRKIMSGLLIMAAVFFLCQPALAFDPFKPDLAVNVSGSRAECSWSAIPGAASYQLVWYKPGGGRLVGSSGLITDTRYDVVFSKGGAYRFRVYARAQGLGSTVRSNLVPVEIPNGKVLGKGKVAMTGVFDMTTGGGYDHQKWNGSTEFTIYDAKPWEDFPEVDKEWAIYGAGKLKWTESFSGGGCMWASDSTGRMVVKGRLRYAETTCKMDLKVSVVYPPSNIMGSCLGYPLEPQPLETEGYALDDVNFVENTKVVKTSGSLTDEFLFTNLDVDFSTGCVP